MDLALLKQKRQEAQNLQTRGGNKYMWSPEEGDQIIRLVPYIHNMEWPFTMVYKHFNISKIPFVSPITYGRRDPIKEFGDELRQQAAIDKSYYKLAAMCEPKVQNYIPILVRGKENEGVKFWALGVENYNKILDYMNEPSYGDITNPETGRDIKVTFKKATREGAYSTTTILVMPDRTPVTTDQNVLQSFANMPNIFTLLTEPSLEELYEILEKFKLSGKRVETSIGGKSNNADQPPVNNGTAAQMHGTPVADGPKVFGGSMNTPSTPSTTATYQDPGNPVAHASFAQYFKQKS